MVRIRFAAWVIVAVGASTLLAVGAGTADASCRYIPTIADGRFRGPFTISNSTQDLDSFFQPRFGRTYSVEALIVSEPYYSGNLSGNVDSADCPSSDMQGLHRTESI